MDNQHLLWNPDLAFGASAESSECPLLFDASISGDNPSSSENDFGGLSSLRLSGRIISVTFTIPYNLRAQKGGHGWVRTFNSPFSPSYNCDLSLPFNIPKADPSRKQNSATAMTTRFSSIV